ncbi:MAG: NrfD/PsrC family molybdoenzyme membrane anchor subunit [Chloroflexota bacterium]|nr:NrfD/PsrC family molybdoenzyme membrane anchor subunit [Chloroflexota bacterium]
MPTSNGHHAVHVLTKTPVEVNSEVLAFSQRASRRFWWLVAALAGLFLLGVVGFIIRLGNGLDERLPWGYYGATFMFILVAAGGAPIVSIGFRLVRNHWRRPLARAAELYAIVGPLLLLMFIPLLVLLPSAEGRRTIWFKSAWREGWPIGAPHAWDLLAVVGLAVMGLVLLWLAALPDLATIRDQATGWRQRWASRLAFQWRGTLRQWRVHKAALGVAGALYFMFLVFTITLLSSDFGLSFVPGWKDAIFPPTQALLALHSGLALTVLTMFLLRKYGGFSEYLGLDQFWSIAKILLALSLLWFYFWWSGFITFWYGRTTTEQNLLRLFMTGPYAIPFIISFLFSFIIPMLTLIPNQVRKSILGPTLVSVSILIGNFFNQLRFYVASFSTETLTGIELEHVPQGHPPGAPDILIIVGALAGVALLFLLATRLVPVLSMWEVNEGVRLRVKGTFMGREVAILAKPD